MMISTACSVDRWYLNNPLRNYNYLLTNPQKRHSLIVDPTSPEPYISTIEKHHFTVEAILLTHAHNDHIAGVQALVKRYQCPVYAAFTETRYFHVDRLVKNREKITFKTSEAEVIATPGHTASHVGYYFKSEAILFCGDTLFAAGIGNAKDPSADLGDLYQSMIILGRLPEMTKIYPAHDYFENNLKFALSVDPTNQNYQSWYQKVKGIPAEQKPVTTIADEWQMNIFMHADSLSLQEVLAEKSVHLNNPEAVFRYLRSQKDAF